MSWESFILAQSNCIVLFCQSAEYMCQHQHLWDEQNSKSLSSCWYQQLLASGLRQQKKVGRQIKTLP